MTTPQGTLYKARTIVGLDFATAPQVSPYVLDSPQATSHKVTLTEAVTPPSWARYSTVYLDVTGITGTTKTVDLAFSYVDPVSGTVTAFPGSGITQITAAGAVVVGFDPYAADDDTGPVYTLHCPANVPLSYSLAFGTKAENEIQTIDLGDIGAADTYTLTFNAHATSAITYSADQTAAIQAALEALVDFAPGDLVVTQTSASVYVVTFQSTGAYGATDVGAITITNPTTFTPTGVTETNKGVVGDETYDLTLSFFFSK